MIETDEVLNEWFKRRFPRNEIGDSYYDEWAARMRSGLTVAICHMDSESFSDFIESLKAVRKAYGRGE